MTKFAVIASELCERGNLRNLNANSALWIATPTLSARNDTRSAFFFFFGYHLTRCFLNLSPAHKAHHFGFITPLKHHAFKVIFAYDLPV